MSAEDGGSKFPMWPSYEIDEVAVVGRVLESGKVNYWTGTEGRMFEQELAFYVDCKYGVALANGTVALELALAALGVGEGDEVIVTSYTFIASASAIVLRGAIPVCADVDKGTLNTTAKTIKPLITTRTKAIVAVHLVGQPCDMDPIMALAEQYNLKVIEDCAQAHGATYKGKKVGSIGHVAAFSFCQDKIMTTGGEGGMLTTNDKSIWEFAWAYKDHGKSYKAMHDVKPERGFNWVHESFGTNWRMTEMQAAIGRVQLTKLPGWLESRRRNARELDKGFTDIEGIRVLVVPDSVEHAYYKYYVFVELKKLKDDWDRNRIVNALSAEGVPCFAGICPEIYREVAFTSAGFGPKERHANARACGESSLMFLVHPTLSSEHMNRTIEIVAKVMASAVV